MTSSTSSDEHEYEDDFNSVSVKEDDQYYEHDIKNKNIIVLSEDKRSNEKETLSSNNSITRRDHNKNGYDNIKTSNSSNSSNSKKKRRETEMTIEECIDMDVDVLTSTIENSCQQLKREFLNQFVEARRRIKEKGMMNLEVQREEYESSLQTKQEEINILNDEMKEMIKNEEKINDVLIKSLNEIYKANINKKIWRMVTLLFMKWHNYTKYQKRISHMMIKAIIHCDMNHYKKRVMNSWREWKRQEYHKNMKNKIKDKIDESNLKLTNEYEKKLKALENEKFILEEKLKEEEKIRCKLEEDMKQAFMRGVCALNLEALTVMKRGVNNGNKTINSMINEDLMKAHEKLSSTQK